MSLFKSFVKKLFSAQISAALDNAVFMLSTSDPAGLPNFLLSLLLIFLAVVWLLCPLASFSDGMGISLVHCDSHGQKKNLAIVYTHALL